jgi:quercetin dioxygenase-like cupin family protein
VAFPLHQTFCLPLNHLEEPVSTPGAAPGAPDKDWAAKAEAMGGSVPIDETARSASKGGPVRHAHMHRTRSIDYAIVLSGEVWAVMDVGETRLTAGDVLIQRGTNHAWANRSNTPCIVAFVLIDAQPLE